LLSFPVFLQAYIYSKRKMNQPKRYLITAALPYANGGVHIGHMAGVYIPADIYVRYLRARKKDVKFVCGSDEHGVPITIRALKEGVSPQEIVNKYHALIKESFEQMGISFDIYSRTSNKVHHETASAFFTKLYNDGLFEEKETEQYYDEAAKTFLADRYIIGTCPVCGNPNAYGDQCERCGTSLSPEQLINPRSTLSDAPLVKRKTTHWYFPLQNYEPWLKEWVLEGHKEWKNNVYGQCKSWLDSGLHPRAMTRDSNWGIKVPLPNAEGKVLYVWFDAPIGYISATKELTDKWADYWCKDDTKLVHFIGKDNIVFHCIIFPAMLKAHGNFVLPDNVPANEFLNIEGEKVSTSRNWAVWVHDYIKDFPGQQDVLRYVLCANAPETKDNDFTWKDFQDRNNSELVSIFGNFVNRALVLTQNHFKNKIPERGELLELDKKVLSELKEFPLRIGASIEAYRFREATASLMDLARLGNKYLADSEPWKLAKTDLNRVGTILNIAIQISANLAILAEPFLPFSSQKLKTMLSLGAKTWAETGGELLPVNHPLGSPQLLYEKIEDDVVEKQIKKLMETKKAVEAASQPVEPAKAEISFDDFGKVDIRIGKIVGAERVEKSKKLLKLKVDTGIDTRTVMSGIAEYFSPEEIIGKQVTLLVNLAPRKIMGVESQGMILMAEDKDGTLRLVQPSEGVSAGSPVR